MQIERNRTRGVLFVGRHWSFSVFGRIAGHGARLPGRHGLQSFVGFAALARVLLNLLFREAVRDLRGALAEALQAPIIRAFPVLIEPERIAGGPAGLERPAAEDNARRNGCSD